MFVFLEMLRKVFFRLRITKVEHDWATSTHYLPGRQKESGSVNSFLCVSFLWGGGWGWEWGGL